MKKCSALVALLMVSGFAVTAHAGGTATLGVTAHVVGTCQFIVANDTLAFGNLDPSVGGDVNRTSSGITFWCTKNATYSLLDDSGLNEAGVGARRMVNSGDPTEFVPYDIAYTASGPGGGRNATITLNIDGTVVESDYTNAAEGDYVDTVTITLNP
jgi:spore coat protein U-like protein